MTLLLSRASLVVVCLVLCAGTALCQDRDGFTAQETPGLALIKPQAWSKESSATILEFEAFTDRRAQGATASGYIEFRTKSGQTRQIDSSKIFQIVVYPDAERLTDVVEPGDRERIAATLAEIDAVVKRFPMTRSYLAPKVGGVLELLKRFDGGEVKVEGEWVSRRAFQEQQAAQIFEILKSDIEQARPPSAFNLDADPKYLFLLTLAKTSPKAKKLAADLKDSHSAKVHGEERTGILKQLASPTLSLAQARELVGQLAQRSAEGDPAAKAVLELWQSTDLEAVALAKIADPLASQIEAQLHGVTEVASPPSLSTETKDAVEALARRLTAFRQANPPPQILEVATRASAVTAVATALEKSATLFPEKKFLDAKNALDAASGQAPSVGPQSERIVAGLQTFAAERIRLFSIAREEANSHLDAGRTQEALQKFEEAYEIIPDPTIARSIEELKSAITAQQP